MKRICKEIEDIEALAMLEVGSGVIAKSHRLQDMFLSFLVCSVTGWNSTG